MGLKTVVYTSDKKTNIFKELNEIFKDIKSSNFLATQMAKRDLQAQYRQSYLGLVWAFLPIIVNSLVWIFLNSSGAINVNAPSGIPYPLYVIIGTTIWTIFIESLQMPINSINGGKSIISKINFPKEALLISGYYKFFFNLILKIIVIIAFLIIFQVSPNASFIYFPIYLIIMMAFGSAIGIILAPIGLLYTDISRMITMGSQFLMYVTPVVYMVPESGWSKLLFELNPLTYLITDTRNTLVGMEINYLLLSGSIGFFSILIFLFGLVFLRKSINILIEKIS